jgi:hypothetical protein
MGQSESRDSRDSRGSIGGYYDGRVQYYTETPRYEIKRDSYEFWNTVDGRVRNSVGDRQIDFSDKPRTVSITQFQPIIEAPVARLIEQPRPISSSFPVYGAPIYSQPISGPIPLATIPTYSTQTYSTPTYSTPYVQPMSYVPAPVSYYSSPGIYASR